MTQAQLAEEMNYSTRYIRKIKEHALQKLRSALACKYPECLRVKTKLCGLHPLC